jgi:hypothetical protein
VTLATSSGVFQIRRNFEYFQVAVRWCQGHYEHRLFATADVHDYLHRKRAWSDCEGVLVKYRNHDIGTERRGGQHGEPAVSTGKNQSP